MDGWRIGVCRMDERRIVQNSLMDVGWYRMDIQTRDDAGYMNGSRMVQDGMMDTGGAGLTVAHGMVQDGRMKAG